MNNNHCAMCSKSGVCLNNLKNNAFSNLTFDEKKLIIERRSATPELQIIQTKGIISAVCSVTFNINENLEFDVKLDENTELPKFKSETSTHTKHKKIDLNNRRYGHNINDKEVKVTTKKQEEYDSSKSEDSVTDSKESETSVSNLDGSSTDTDSLFQDTDESESDSSYKLTTARLKAPHRDVIRGHKTTMSSKKKTRYRVGTTMRKKQNSMTSQKQHTRKTIDIQTDFQIKTKDTKDHKYKSDTVGLFINKSHVIFYNDTHYSPYFKQMQNGYNINKMWAKQTNVKVFDNSFKLPLISHVHNLSREHKPKTKDLRTIKNILRNKKKFQEDGNKSTSFLRSLAVAAMKFVGLNFENTKVKTRTPYSDTFNVSQWVHDFVNNITKTTEKPNPNNLFITLNKTMQDTLVNTVSNLVKEELDKELKKPKENFEKKINETVDALNNLLSNIKNALRFNDHNTIYINTAVNKDIVKNITENLEEQLKDKFNPEFAQEEFNKRLNKTFNMISELLKNITQHVHKMESYGEKEWRSRTYKVQDNIKVRTFIEDLPKRFKRFLHKFEKKNTDNDYKWQKALKKIGRIYNEKFNQYFQDTKRHKIKSRLGTDRVILNSINVSNRIIERLFNFMLGDLYNKGSLRNNDFINDINTEVKEETKTQLDRACSELNICRKNKGIVPFLIDFTTILLSLDDGKFEKAFNALSVVVEETDFSKNSGTEVNKKIKAKMARNDKLHIVFKRASVAVIKNILGNRNSPLIVHGDSNLEKVNKTLSLLEITDILDKKVPDSEKNLNEQASIKAGIEAFAENQSGNIKNIMSAFVKHVDNAFGQLDEQSITKVRQDLKIVFL